MRVAADSTRERDAMLYAVCPVLVVPAPEMAHDLHGAVRRTRRFTRVPADRTV
ncbi:hypothetical protein ACQP04_23405 [Pseudonocardia halophobica]|uniref:hypothetical protein n=1 Tax=Pseudonocardia halophobica TaxID=29401 RepID=UPI003D92F21F